MTNTTMPLNQLLTDIVAVQTQIPSDCSITGLTCDSRLVKPGFLFFALRGTQSDGHAFISAAVVQGAAAVILEDSSYAPTEVPWIVVSDIRRVMARLAARFHHEPTKNKPLIGITGTNGKTTTSYLIESILNAAALPAAVLGTISYRFGETILPASHTTPESTELQAVFAELAEVGAKAFVMEVSSHALEQHRVDGADFNVGVFTNLTRDHLDYHGTMEAYQEAKVRLFEELLRPNAEKADQIKAAVINLDDPAAPTFINRSACAVLTYGLSQGADVTARDIIMDTNGIHGILVTPNGEAPFRSKLLGTYNIQNILGAAAAGIALGLSLEAIVTGIINQTNVPGRLERVENDCGITCLVDYAHTGDALQNVLSTLRGLAQQRLITVFGCGGDRDTGKRPVMGNIATTISDITIVTSDNPRTEQPAAIIADIRSGISKEHTHYFTPEGLRQAAVSGTMLPSSCHTIIENRQEAIELAITLAIPGDIVLLAGKGHEDYQIIGTVKTHFDDRIVAYNALKERHSHVH